MPLDERTLRYLASLGITGAPAPAAPQGLASTLQQLGGVGGRRLPNPVSDRQTIVAGGAPQQTINVNTGTTTPSGAAKPSTADESALASQAGWAGANEAVAPYLGDWRATPAQILAAAVGGYQRSRYAAQQDIAAQRQQQQLFDLKKQEMEAEQAGAQAQADQRTAIMAEIRKLPPGEQTIALLDPEGWAKAKAGQMFPEPAKPMQVGNDVIDPTTGKLIYRAPFAPQRPDARYDISGGVVLDRFTGQTTGIPVASAPDTQLGKLLAEMNALAPDDPRREVYKAAISKATTAAGGMSVGFDENGNPVIETGGGSAPKPPTGYRWTDSTYGNLEPIPGGPGEAASAEIAGKAAMLPGSIADVQSVRDMLIDENGDVKYGHIAAANPPIPSIPFLGSVGPLPSGRDVTSRITGAIDTLIRARTGAAATEGEMSRMTGMYMPSYMDSPEVVKSKLERLDRDLRVMQDQFMRGKGGVANAPQIPSPEVQGQTIMNKSGAREPAPTVDNGQPSPAAQPPAQKRDPAAFIRDHW